ncbi:MAG TPA: 50S ribosomal protein L6 [Steroidobacteraceae bacterium]|nr:50S ribosomal protein L6 [Steroidobacteraceae bacterium]
MSRVARKPVTLPQGVTTTVDGDKVTVKGAKGTLALPLRRGLGIVQEGQSVRVEVVEPAHDALMHAGSLRANLANVVEGVSKGYEKKLELVGVGYRAQAQGRNLNLTLGFSHPVVYAVPEGITVETPTQTEILVKGADKQQVGQVAAEIRAYRAPEPYKGKGVRYSGERIELKETKKK